MKQLIKEIEERIEANKILHKQAKPVSSKEYFLGKIDAYQWILNKLK